MVRRDIRIMLLAVACVLLPLSCCGLFIRSMNNMLNDSGAYGPGEWMLHELCAGVATDQRVKDLTTDTFVEQYESQYIRNRGDLTKLQFEDCDQKQEWRGSHWRGDRELRMAGGLQWKEGKKPAGAGKVRFEIHSRPNERGIYRVTLFRIYDEPPSAKPVPTRP